MKRTIYCTLLFLGISFTHAQTWTPVNGGLTTTASSVSIGTGDLSARLHIADGYGGEQLRLTRGLGSIRFAQDVDKDNLYLFNKDASKLYMFWHDNGNVGIGTNNPYEKLTIAGNIQLNGVAYPKIQLSNRLMMQMPIALENSYTRSFIGQNIDWNGSTSKWRIHDLTYTDFAFLRFENGGVIGFYNKPGSSTEEITNAEMEAYRRLTITENGNVLIAKASQNNSSYKLDVNGNVRANKVVVNTTGADFVFDDNYRLRKLEDLQKYIRQYKHLPEIPSAKEMGTEGQDVGALNIKLLQKVEELTLYMIEMKKENDQIKQANLALKKRMEKLEKRK